MGKSEGGSAMYFLLILTIFGGIQTWGVKRHQGGGGNLPPDKSSNIRLIVNAIQKIIYFGGVSYYGS